MDHVGIYQVISHAIVALTVVLTAPMGHVLAQENIVVGSDVEEGRIGVIALFGATGTIGDGVLQAATGDPDTRKIIVVTRRASPRIEAGLESGLVEMVTHLDYLDYTPLREIIEHVDAVYWALGTSASNVTDDEYGRIHVDFPVQFVREWLDVRGGDKLSFHLVSGSGAGADSWFHWAREKARAEAALFKLAEGTKLRVASYRPSFIVPTDTERTTIHHVMQTVLAPFSAAVHASGIGRAMLEVTARSDNFENGTIFENKDILRMEEKYLARHGSTGTGLD
jgi:uncharacterized protein YbjT (DUF2867 family)